MIEFSNKSRPRTIEKKDENRDTFEGVYVLHED